MSRPADTALELAYASGLQRASLPSDWSHHRLRTAESPAVRSEDGVIDAILSAPFGPSLRDFLDPSQPLLVLVSDKTRRCRTSVFLPRLLRIVHDAGIPPERVRLLFATGTHAPQSAEEKREILGDAIFERYAVHEHVARDEESCIEVGTTRFGTPVRVNRLLAGARQVLATGTIVHHYFAGFGGGAKLFVPGVASYSTAVANHRRTITAEGRFHPGCGDGIVEGNPVIEDIMDARRFMPRHWYFAALLDGAGRIADGVCGDMEAAHAEGCTRVDARFRVPVDRLADLTIVSAGGHPKDINLIQAHKALHHASYATRDGGTIICLAACRDGIGNNDFLRWFDLSDDAFREAILEHYAMNAHTALTLREKARRFHIVFVSELPGAQVRAMGMEPASSLAEAIERVHPDLGPDTAVTVIENGSLTVPHYRENRG